MDKLIIVMALFAGFHAYTYGRWLKQQNNKAGALVVFLLAAAAIGLPAYRIWKAQ